MGKISTRGRAHTDNNHHQLLSAFVISFLFFLIFRENLGAVRRWRWIVQAIPCETVARERENWFVCLFHIVEKLVYMLLLCVCVWMTQKLLPLLLLFASSVWSESTTHKVEYKKLSHRNGHFLPARAEANRQTQAEENRETLKWPSKSFLDRKTIQSRLRLSPVPPSSSLSLVVRQLIIEAITLPVFPLLDVTTRVFY